MQWPNVDIPQPNHSHNYELTVLLDNPQNPDAQP